MDEIQTPKENFFLRHLKVLLWTSIVLLVLGMGAIIYISVSEGIFITQFPLRTKFTSGYGLRKGTEVMLSGVHVGEVKKVVIQSENNILVLLGISKFLEKHIFEDAAVEVIQPDPFASRVLNLLPGTEGRPLVARDDFINGIDARDFWTARQEEKRPSERLTRPKSFFGLLAELQPTLIVLQELAYRIQEASPEVFAKLNPTLNSLQKISKQAEVIMPDMAQAMHEILSVSDQIKAMLQDTQAILKDLRQITPTVAELTPVTHDMVKAVGETLEELVITLQGMQESFLLKGGMRRAREKREKAKEEPQTQRDLTEEKPRPRYRK